MILDIFLFVIKVIVLAVAVEILEFCFYSFVRNVWQVKLLMRAPKNWWLALTETTVITLMLYFGYGPLITLLVAFCVLITRKELARLLWRK